MRKLSVFISGIFFFIFISNPISTIASSTDIEYIEQILAKSQKELLFSIVYVTNTGHAYHNYECHYLRSCNERLLINAIEDGYKPCSYCNPPNIPDSYFIFQKMDTEGEINDTVYIYDNAYHREDCPKNNSSNTCSLIDVCTSDIDSCKYCNPPKLSYYKILEYNRSQNLEKEKGNTVMLLITLIVIFVIAPLFFLIFNSIYVKSKDKKTSEDKSVIQENVYTNDIKYVYLTRTGNCYHKTPMCRCIKSQYIKVTYDYAKNRRSRCTICYKK